MLAACAVVRSLCCLVIDRAFGKAARTAAGMSSAFALSLFAALAVAGDALAVVADATSGEDADGAVLPDEQAAASAVSTMIVMK